MTIETASPSATSTKSAIMTSNALEARRPPRNALASGDGFGAWLSARIQLFADLQVASASRHAKRWLRQRRGSILEVGCGDQPYSRYVPSECHYVAIDQRDLSQDFEMDTRSSVIYYSGATFPVSEEKFDSLFHTEVLEHVFETTLFLGECRRALRPNGEMFFTVPFQARYHFKPYDYFRFTPAALHRLLSESGFDEINIEPRGNDITVAFYKFAAVGFRWAYSGLAGKLLFLLTAPFTFVALLCAHGASALRLGSDDDCLGYSVTARKGKSDA